MSTTPEGRNTTGADAQDADFGRQAKEKEEHLDEALSHGDESPDETPEEKPRAAGKAEPA